ncbi:TauD/TfdA family dioxygenase [Streptomyces sp. NPDC046876]|uniref:TauD/TfdA family dioxygenase n=1 Tax=Streptomyces sp. NPDC046876 TaxID=3155616 RepID=UPI0033CE9E79
MTSAPSASAASSAAPAPSAPPASSAPPSDAGPQDPDGPADSLVLLHVPDTADAATWLQEQRHALRATVLDHGAVLVRGLGIKDPADVGRALRQLGAAPVTETEAFAARQTHGEGVYSSAAWPPNQPMCMHHELSYTTEFPSLLLFGCLTPPTTGGATTVADAAAVLDALPAEVTEPFLREGWLLTRTYGNDIGASLTEAFGTDDRGAIEQHCRTHAIAYEWLPDGTLRTRQRRSAVLRHPETGRRCWFNQIAFLNEWTLDPDIRDFLIDAYGAEGLPFNTHYGNGAPLDRDTVQLINEVYEAHTVRRPWEAGDLMLVDNLRTAHAREAFQGPRQVVVAMADPRRAADCDPTIEVTLP